MGNWSQIAAIPANRNEAAACWHGGKVYVAGGLAINSSTSVSYQNTLFIYDPAGNTWTTGAVLPAVGLAYAFSATDGVHLVFPETGAHYVYDPGTNTWAADTTAPVVARRDAHHFVDASGRFYLAGGRPSSGTANVVAVHRFDPATDLWTARADLPGTIAARLATINPGVLGSDSKVYLGYGSRVNPGISVYDPATDTWATAPAMPDAVDATSVSLSRLPSGIILALPHQRWSGSSTPLLQRVDGYDPATGLWTMGVIPNYPGTAAGSSVATEPGGLVYLLGGLVQPSNDPGVTTAQAWAYKQNEPPSPATLLTLTGGVLVSTAAKNRARHGFNDPNTGDSQSKFDWRHRIVGDPTWITGTETTPNPWYDIDAGTLDPGNYERQVLTYDAAGEPATAWTPSGFFTAADPPAGPSITYPINGQILDQVEYVEWSTPAQTEYRVRRVADDGTGNPDEATVYFDTGNVVDSLVRRVTLNFETNSRTEHVQVQIKSGGLWSDWVSVSGDVSYTPPPTPSWTAYPDPSTGSLLIMITTPDPVDVGDPAAAYVNVYVDDGQGEELKASQLPINTSWRYWTPRSGRDYVTSIRVEAVAANGTTASSS